MRPAASARVPAPAPRGPTGAPHFVARPNRQYPRNAAGTGASAAVGTVARMRPRPQPSKATACARAQARGSRSRSPHDLRLRAWPRYGVVAELTDRESREESADSDPTAARISARDRSTVRDALSRRAGWRTVGKAASRSPARVRHGRVRHGRVRAWAKTTRSARSAIADQTSTTRSTSSRLIDSSLLVASSHRLESPWPVGGCRLGTVSPSWHDRPVVDETVESLASEHGDRPPQHEQGGQCQRICREPDGSCSGRPDDRTERDRHRKVERGHLRERPQTDHSAERDQQ